MTRKDYVLIAEAISAEAISAVGPLSGAQIATLRKLASRLANKIAADNPRFDAERFVKACGF